MAHIYTGDIQSEVWRAWYKVIWFPSTCSAKYTNCGLLYVPQCLRVIHPKQRKDFFSFSGLFFRSAQSSFVVFTSKEAGATPFRKLQGYLHEWRDFAALQPQQKFWGIPLPPLVLLLLFIYFLFVEKSRVLCNLLFIHLFPYDFYNFICLQTYTSESNLRLV